MPKAKDRLVIDTNIWISFLLTNDFSKLDKILANEAAVLVFSQELLDEFIAVAHRPKFKKWFSLSVMEHLLGQIAWHSEFIAVTSNVSVCSDAKDNFLLSLSVDGNATHLITGDKDLIDLKRVDKTEILTITSYLSEK